VETFLDMCTTQEFRPFYWLYPGTYQPLQATAILLDDVLKSPFSAEAQHSRMLVERLFSLVGPYGEGLSKGMESIRNVTPTGKEVWEMLRRLRRRAWKKACIDPDMAWLDDNFVHSVGEIDSATTVERTASHSTDGEYQPGGTAPAWDKSPTLLAPDTNTIPEDVCTFNPDLHEDNTSLHGQFAPSDVDGLDWSQWDLLVDRYFHMPDQGQVNF
jgi:hypothetical protein